MRSSTVVLILAALVIVPGCNRGGTERVPVSGKVTFQGKPVPYGNITFEPDREKGNQGPQGYVKIQDGKYDSAVGGTAPCPGLQNVAIEGYPELGSEKPGEGRLVFNYRTTWELPKQAATKDFDVPASAGKREGISNAPPP
jgi:hypothetical protein